MVSNRYTLSNLKKALEKPNLFLYEGKRIFLSLKNGYRYGQGVEVMSEDWDNLLILDACRHDYFAEVNNLPGELNKVTSRGKSSWGFIKANFVGKELHDTVVVSANPYYTKIDEDTFYTINSTLHGFDYDDDSSPTLDQWHPETVQREAVDAHQQFPNKRLIVHFMQPHQPFIGSMGDELRDQLTQEENRESPGDFYVPWEKADVSLYRKAYKENIDIVLDYVKNLIEQLDGKTVITADHGELLGEKVLGKRAWGHGFHKEVPQTREVPWFIIDSNDRREIVAEEPIEMDELDDESLSQHLEALGYK